MADSKMPYGEHYLEYAIEKERDTRNVTAIQLIMELAHKHRDIPLANLKKDNAEHQMIANLRKANGGDEGAANVLPTSHLYDEALKLTNEMFQGKADKAYNELMNMKQLRDERKKANKILLAEEHNKLNDAKERMGEMNKEVLKIRKMRDRFKAKVEELSKTYKREGSEAAEGLADKRRMALAKKMVKEENLTESMLEMPLRQTMSTLDNINFFDRSFVHMNRLEHALKVVADKDGISYPDEPVLKLDIWFKDKKDKRRQKTEFHEPTLRNFRVGRRVPKPKMIDSGKKMEVPFNPRVRREHRRLK